MTRPTVGVPAGMSTFQCGRKGTPGRAPSCHNPWQGTAVVGAADPASLPRAAQHSGAYLSTVGNGCPKNQSMKVDGACHCGDVTFAAEIDLEAVSICHCTDCQTLSGSAFRTGVRTKSGTFELRSGAPTIYVKTTAESGAKREHAFCPRCGTPIYSTSMGPGPKVHSLRIATLRSRHALMPKRQIWTRSRVAWLDALDGLTAAEKQE